MTLELFDREAPYREDLCTGAVILRGYALADDRALLNAVRDIERHAPFRHLITPGGLRMSVAMTNCGELGWMSDHAGYRYTRVDPLTRRPWPPMPALFRRLARAAAAAAGFGTFSPDACLVNRYTPRTKLSLHQDRDERDAGAPIVSVSLGIPATFLFGGVRRTERARRVPLLHGDVAVWGGPARLNYHGIAPLKEDVHPLLGALRINLTFRKAV